MRPYSKLYYDSPIQKVRCQINAKVLMLRSCSRALLNMLLVMLLSFAFHWLVDWVACRFPVKTLSRHFRNLKQNDSISGTDFAWRTSVISEIHALVTGLGSPLV